MLETTIKLLELIGVDEKDIADLNSNGKVLEDSYQVREFINIIRDMNTHEARGHLTVSGFATVDYSDVNRCSVDRYSNVLYFGKGNVKLDSVDKFKIYISNYDWYDVHLHCDNTVFTICFSPK